MSIFGKPFTGLEHAKFIKKKKKTGKKMLKMNFAKDSFFFFLGVKNYSQPIKLFLYSSEFTYFVCHFTNFLKDLKALRRWITHDNL